jgi:hypothetical protein
MLGTGQRSLLLSKALRWPLKYSALDDWMNVGDDALQSISLRPGFELTEAQYRTVDNVQTLKVQGSPFRLRQWLRNL